MRNLKLIVSLLVLLAALAVPRAAAAHGVVVLVPPPPPRVEVIPPRPYHGAVWVEGTWGWRHGRHRWSRGHYVHGRPGHVWAPRVWVHGGHGWHSRHGHWHRVH